MIISAFTLYQHYSFISMGKASVIQSSLQNLHPCILFQKGFNLLYQVRAHKSFVVSCPFSICFLCLKMLVCMFNSRMLPCRENWKGCICFLWDISCAYSCKMYSIEHHCSQMAIKKLKLNAFELILPEYFHLLRVKHALTTTKKTENLAIIYI